MPIVEIIAEFLKAILWDIIWRAVLFNLGRIFLLIITAGAYPHGIKLEKDINFISAAGFGMLLSAWSSIAIYNNWSDIAGLVI